MKGVTRRQASLRFMRLWLMALGACWYSLALNAAERVDIVAFEYPPIYQDSQGPDKGLAIDLAIAAFRAVDVDVSLRFFPVARMIRYVEDGLATCAIGGRVLFEDPAVAPKVKVGSVIHYVTQTFIYDRRRFPDGIRYAQLERLSGLRIGALHSSGILKYLQKTDGLNLIPNNTHEGSARQLQAERIDLWAIVDLTGYLYLKMLFGGEAEEFERTASFNRGDVSLVCSRQQDANGVYARKFAEGLSRIKKNGTYLQIMAKYYGDIKRINPESLPDDMK